MYKTKFFSWAKWMDQDMECPLLLRPRAQQLYRIKTLQAQGQTVTSAVFRGALYQIEVTLAIDITLSTYSRCGHEIRVFCGL